jgi:hypothetical protein
MASGVFDTKEILNSVIKQVYNKAFDRNSHFQIPITLVDDPETAHSIFRNTKVFEKNYDFLDSLGPGRFSSNGDEWILRKELTQSFYSNASKVLNQDTIHLIYRNIFKQKVNLDDANLYDHLIEAAIEVISRTFGLNIIIPWPQDLIIHLRDCLKKQQAISWEEKFDVDAYHKNRASLNQIFKSIKNLWQTNSELSIFLRNMDHNASNINNFDSSAELMQNLLASSETVASSILWNLECACRYSHLFKNTTHPVSEADIDLFVMECLRLYPPVPFVTRVCVEDCRFHDITFKKNDSILISIVGIHTHPYYWQDPLSFHPNRSEFTDNTYTKLSYIPFLSGSRTCAGMKIANTEIRSALKAFFELFTIEQCNEARKFDLGISSKPGIHLEKYFTRI